MNESDSARGDRLPMVRRNAVGRIIVRSYRNLAPIGICLYLLVLAGCAAPPTESGPAASASPLQPGMARVWVLRQPNPPGGNVAGADPMVYANGSPIAQSAPGTVYFHDFQPGSYRFTVQPYGVPANLVDPLQLAPGMQAYVQVQAVANWQEGSTVGGASFAVLTMSPSEAQAYMRDMANLGQR
jgi:hypothetical protein